MHETRVRKESKSCHLEVWVLYSLDLNHCSYQSDWNPHHSSFWYHKFSLCCSTELHNPDWFCAYVYIFLGKPEDFVMLNKKKTECCLRPL